MPAIRGVTKLGGRSLAAQLVLGPLAALSSPGLAQPSTETVVRTVEDVAVALEARAFGDLRFRFENAVDEARPEAGRALTARLRTGLEVSPDPRLTILGEFEGNLRIAGSYDDLVNGDTSRAVIPDPAFAELNRLSVRLEPWRDVALIVGRQYLSFDDERFIGRVAFRQNDQTYDAARLSVSFANGVGVDAVYFWRTNRILSDRNDEGRFRGDSFLLNVGVPLPVGRLVGFHYALDLAAGSKDALDKEASSQTTGLRYEGRAAWPGGGEDAPSLKWEASYARQRDFAGAPAEFSANYWLGALTGDIGDFSVSARFEILGANNGEAFQTPLGTLHAFQGAADLFVTTPADGVRERSGLVEWRAGRVGPFEGVTLSLAGLSFQSANGSVGYGREFDASIRARVAGAALSIKAADYAAAGFGEDVRRLWIAAERSF